MIHSGKLDFTLNAIYRDGMRDAVQEINKGIAALDHKMNKAMRKLVK